MAPKAGEEVWKYGMDRLLHGPDKLPDSFQTTGTLRGDYMQLAKQIGVPAFHPAFKPPKGKAKKDKKADVDPPVVDSELPVFTVQSIRMDRISAHIMGLILPLMRHLKVVRFNDCRLDLDMLRLLRSGLTGQCSVECLQVDWNPVDQSALHSARLSARVPSSPGENSDPGEDEPGDPGGVAFARFLEPDCVLECVSLRACNVSHDQVVPLTATLKKCPWQLRQLNLWENNICDDSAATLAGAFEEYRGLEYLGLGRNKITDQGIKALLAPFSAQILDEAEKATKADDIKAESANWAAAAKAKAKAKAKAQPDARRTREPTCFGCSHDAIDEKPAPEGGEAGPSWILRRHCELKALSLMENPIKSVAEIEKLQPFGPKRAELTLLGTPAAAAIIARFPELSAKDRKAFVFPGSAQEVPGGDAGWTLRLI